MKTMMSNVKIVVVALACLMLGVLFFVGGSGEVKAEESVFVPADSNTQYAYVAVSGTDVSVGKVPELTVPDGYLFAGWFKTTACTKDDAVRTTADVTASNTYYAKYVPEDVLSIRAQISTVAGQSGDGNATRNIRFVSSVDSLAYSKVGFKLEFGETTKYNNSTTVFERIESKTTGDEFTFSPKIIDTDSEYFITATWKDVLETDTTGFYVRAYIKTLDGVVVYGPSRYVTVKDGLTTNQVIVPVKGTVEANATVTYNDGTTACTASKVEVINNTNKDTDDVYTHVRITLAGAKKDLDSVTTFAVTGTNLTSKYRYPYTTYTGSGTEDTTWYNSTDNEFVIATSADLYGLANQSTQFTASDKIYVVSDIMINTGKATAWGTTAPSLAWTPIYNFAGKFDGQGHTISGLYGKSNTEMGLFTSTANTTEITNLKVTNSYFEASVSGLSAISGSGRGIFKNIYVDAMLIGTGGDTTGAVGGILGEAKPKSTTLTEQGTVEIENCWSNCTIQVNGKWVGGILGSANASDVTVSIKHCLNTGIITHTSATDAYRFFGGIVGATGKAADANKAFTMDDCLNVGTVTTSGGTNKAQGAVIGQVGGCLNITNTYALDTSTNNGLVIGNHITGFSGTKRIEFMAIDKLKGDKAKTTDLDFDEYWSIVDGAVPELKTFEGTLWTDTTWFDTTANSGTIMTKNQLYGFASLAADGKFNSSSKVYLGEDITVNEGTASDWGTTAPKHEWTPISAFAGTFDGKGHTISGLYGKSNTEMGLFTSTANTTVIENLKVTNSYLETSVLGLGTISGAGRGTFKNIYADAILVGTGADASGNVGGILGAAKEGTVTIENCWSNCTIQSDGKRVGGIIGNALANDATVRIKHCLNTGTVTLKYTDGNVYRLYGGLVGSTGTAKDVDGISTFTMEDCLNTGTVTWIGKRNTFQGAISGETLGTAKITNTYYLEGVCTDPETVTGNTSNTVNVSIEKKTASELKGVNADTNTDLDFVNYWSPVYESTPVLTTFADDLDVLCVDTSWYDTTTKGGSITTRSQLYGFIALVDSGKFDSSSEVYLGADITVNEGTASDWGTTAPKHVWTPISAFAGTFDGQGHTISGLYGKSTGYMGLFQNTAVTTKITNLKVTNSYFETSTSGLSAISSHGRGTFSNIYADATLVGTGAGEGVAGILGISMPGTVTIENCWSHCTIQADGKRVGGILGSARADVATVSIKHCLNTGTITYTGTESNHRFFGGIVGTTGTATDVDGISTFTMDDCLNVGTVTTSGGTNASQGAIIGQVAGTADITNTYALYTGSEIVIGNQAAGFTGTRDVHFRSAELLEGENAKGTTLDFVNYWTTVTGSTPVLQSFVREEYLSNIDKFTPSWDYDFPEEMMSYENKVAALNAVGENARMISVFHKGGDIQNYPVNSIEALISAIQMGADVVEVDLVKTKDGHIVLMHDETLSEYTDYTSKQGVNGLPTADDVTQWEFEDLRQLRLKNPDGTISGYVIPTLEEALMVSKGRVKLVFDKMFTSTLGTDTPVLYWDTEIYPIIEKTGAWDTWILPYQYNSTTQIEIAEVLKEGSKDDSLNIHAFVGFKPLSITNTTDEDAEALREKGITPIAYWRTALVTDTELTDAADALTTLKTSIRIMGQNHQSAGGTETSTMWDTLLNNGVNMVLADKGFELQKYIAEKFYTTNQ